MSELLTVGQAATLAGVSVRTMRRRVAAGEVMTSGHGQARRIVAASVVAGSAPGDPATVGQAVGTPAMAEDNAAMTEDMTEVRADVTEASSATVTPAMAALVALVDRLTAENRDLGRQLVDVSAAAAVWQERARVLGEQLALAAPSQPVDVSGAAQIPEPSLASAPPLLSWRSPAVYSVTAVVLVTIVLAATIVLR